MQYSHCSMRIGGAIAADVVPKLLENLRVYDVDLEAGEVPGEHIEVEVEEAEWGRLDDLEKLCQEHGIAYDRISGDGEMVNFRPGRPIRTGYSGPEFGHEMVEMEKVTRVRDILRDGKPSLALEVLETLVNEVPELPKIVLVGGEGEAS